MFYFSPSDHPGMLLSVLDDGEPPTPDRLVHLAAALNSATLSAAIEQAVDTLDEADEDA